MAMTSNSQSQKLGSVNSATLQPAICDYEGSTYRTDFWTQARVYEDAAERIALGALLPPSGRRLIEIGAGFGRLVELYAGYDQVILFDYSRSMLREARARRGDAAPSGRPRYLYVAGDFYALPFVSGLFDTVAMIRVIHHAQDAPRVLQGIGDIVAPGGTFVLEFANKRNLKAIVRWSLRRQKWNPFHPAPYEFAELNFDFHPHWMQSRLREAGFTIRAQRTVSHLRLGVLKRLVPSQWLVKLDSLVQPTGRWWQLAPSVFIKSQAPRAKPSAAKGDFFRCPICRSTELIEQGSALICQGCQRRWPTHDGLYDFKEPF
jgi:ubiquinone/menaquinone biosynthesis C-methylase UbiE